MRLPWESLPGAVVAGIEEVLGFRVVSTESQSGGFSPGVAARVRGAHGERGFVKAASGLVNSVTPQMHRDEAAFASLLPPSHSSPRFRGSYDDGTWVALVFEEVEGRPPAAPWTPAELAAAVDLLNRQGRVAAVPQLPTVLEALGEEFIGFRLLSRSLETVGGWEGSHLAELTTLEQGWAVAAEGDQWLHLDTRGDNMLIKPDGSAVLVDWPASAAGDPVLDVVAFVPAAIRDGALGAVPWGTDPADVPGQQVAAACEQLFSRFDAARAASPDGVTALVCAFAGLMQYRRRQPPPPAMPTVRGFQASQGEVAMAWLRYRLGA